MKLLSIIASLTTTASAVDIWFTNVKDCGGGANWGCPGVNPNVSLLFSLALFETSYYLVLSWSIPLGLLPNAGSILIRRLLWYWQRMEYQLSSPQRWFMHKLSQVGIPEQYALALLFVRPIHRCRLQLQRKEVIASLRIARSNFPHWLGKSTRAPSSSEQKCQDASVLRLENGQRIGITDMDEHMLEELKGLVANETSSEELAGIYHTFKLKE